MEHPCGGRASGAKDRCLQWLGRSRVAAYRCLGLLLVVGALFVRPVHANHSSFELVLEVVGYLALVVAAVGRLWVSAFIEGRKNRELVTWGPYAFSRNPLYLLSSLAFFGVGLAFGSLVAAAALAAIFAATHWPAVVREERKLAARFGDEYAAYCRQTPRFLPRPAPLRLPPRLEISTPAFTRAAGDAVALLAVFLLVELIEAGHATGVLPSVLAIY